MLDFTGRTRSTTSMARPRSLTSRPSSSTWATPKPRKRREGRERRERPAKPQESCVSHHGPNKEPVSPPVITRRAQRPASEGQREKGVWDTEQSAAVLVVALSQFGAGGGLADLTNPSHDAFHLEFNQDGYTCNLQPQPPPSPRPPPPPPGGGGGGVCLGPG